MLSTLMNGLAAWVIVILVSWEQALTCHTSIGSYMNIEGAGKRHDLYLAGEIKSGILLYTWNNDVTICLVAN